VAAPAGANTEILHWRLPEGTPLWVMLDG